jgi:deoxyribonuclease-1
MLKHSPHHLLLFFLLMLTTACEAERPIEDYYEARHLLWTEVYPNGGETLYCGQRFGARHPKSINVEHVFPMGWVMRELKCGDRKACRRNSIRFNLIEADLHNLYPARKKINRDRSSYAFGIIKGERQEYGKCDFEIDRKKRRVEPREKVRGDIARAVLYMSDKYGIELFKRQKKLMLEWHRADPPDDEEKRRNDVIEILQGNRNPYIDE